MNTKQNIISAFRHRRPETAVPIWELEFHPWDAMSGKHIILGKEFENLTTGEKEKTLYSNAEIMLEVSDEMNFSALTVPVHYWEHSPGQLAYFILPEDCRMRQIEILNELKPDNLMLVAASGGVLAADYSIDFCYKLVDAPEEIDKMAEAALICAIEAIKEYRDCGVEAVFTASDIADNSGPFFNPEQMKRWILPYLKRFAEEIRKLGMFSILHSDGDLRKCINDIANTGVDALQAIDPTAGMDIQSTKNVVGNRLCLCGNINCALLLTGTPEDVFDSTKNLLVTCMEDGGLVLGASNAVQPDVPPENYRAMIEAWKEFGKY
ncbi:MAG: hypothetical protein DRI44_07675 [Chlamydiae bacterium]|nr:MAG: hypothetical protein DRI44_07675 [Chlamydiota bacterium]